MSETRIDPCAFEGAPMRSPDSHFFKWRKSKQSDIKLGQVAKKDDRMRGNLRTPWTVRKYILAKIVILERLESAGENC